MKKSLLKKLTRMARDGDPEAIEALAEAVEEIMENPPADADAAAVVVTAGTEPEPGAPAEEETSAAADEDTLSAILERLDRLIALLSPAGDDVPEELAEAIEESVEAAETTEASGTTAEEVASVMEEIIGPAVSTVLEPEEEEDGDCPAVRESGDALGAALRAIRPALKRMPRSERKRVCAGIAANLKNTGMDSLAYAALADAGARRPAVSDPAELGRRIMASRNPHYK